VMMVRCAWLGHVCETAEETSVVKRHAMMEARVLRLWSVGTMPKVCSFFILLYC